MTLTSDKYWGIIRGRKLQIPLSYTLEEKTMTKKELQIIKHALLSLSVIPIWFTADDVINLIEKVEGMINDSKD